MKKQFQGAFVEKQYYDKLDFCKSVYKLFWLLGGNLCIVAFIEKIIIELKIFPR